MKTHTTICPNCNSINTYPDVSKDMIAWGGITNTKCGDCDYSSTFFPEVPIKNLPQIKLKKKKKKKSKK